MKKKAKKKSDKGPLLKPAPSKVQVVNPKLQWPDGRWKLRCKEWGEFRGFPCTPSGDPFHETTLPDTGKPVILVYSTWAKNADNELYPRYMKRLGPQDKTLAMWVLEADFTRYYNEHEFVDAKGLRYMRLVPPKLSANYNTRYKDIDESVHGEGIYHIYADGTIIREPANFTPVLPADWQHDDSEELVATEE